MANKKSPIFALIAVAGLLAPQISSAQLAPKAKDANYEINAATQIDKLVANGFRSAKVTPPPPASDDQFLRRTYLTVAGRIPSYGESTAFLSDENPEKRSQLIQRLLDSDAYRSHTFNWWADLLRITDEFARTNGTPYKQWIKKAIADNKPYDKLVYELLTASGGGWEKDNGAVGYFVRDKGMPLDNMANTVRIFLGTRMECAQCHNHPNDPKVKQRDFYEISAYTDGLRGVKSKIAGQVGRGDEDKPKEVRDLGRMLRYAVYDFSIEDPKKEEANIKLPYDYDPKNGRGEPNQWIDGRTPSYLGRGGIRARIKRDSTPRETFASWVTSKDNDRFAKVIVNRLWKRTMGTGIFEPVDDLNDKSAPPNPALLEYLATLMKDLDYDMMAFQRIILNSKTYNLGPSAQEVSANVAYHHAGRQLRRMSAEQIWDSLLTLSVDNPDKRKSSDYGNSVYWKGKPVLVGKKTMNDVYKEVVALNSGDAFWKYTADLLKQIKADGGGGKGDAMMMGGGRNYGGMKRASELGSPMKPGHFLRQFGQSSREVIQGASTESDVTQVLSILNGHVERNLVNDSGADVFKSLAEGKSDAEKVNILFMSTLSRKATPDELQFMLAEVKANGDRGYRNVLAALLTTSEFIFVK
ncbi:MAG: hypothetical protein ACI8XO_000900 [Verrucomicrobiales bacterium]|jgi:hypothetical protein